MSTTIKTNFKQHLATLFTQQNYVQVCIDLEEFSFESFENILFSIFTDAKYQEHKVAFSKSFFSEYLPNSKYFEKLIQSSRRRKLFAFLFEYPDLQCKPLYNRLCFDFPETVITILKRHRVPFLHKEHFNQILSSIADEKSSLALFEFGEKLFKISVLEFHYYHKAGLLTKNIIDRPLEETFGMIGLWLHYFTWDLAINKKKDDLNRYDETIAVTTINTIISHILAYRDKTKTQDPFDSVEYQKQIITSKNQTPPNYEIFLAWLKWKKFSTIIDEFCFEDDCSIEFDERGLTIHHDQKSSEEFEHTNWKYRLYNQDIQESDTLDTSNLELDANEKWFINEIGPLYAKEMRQAFDEFINEIYVDEFGIKTEKFIPFCLSKIIWWRIGLIREFNEGIKNKIDWKEILLKLGKGEMKRISDQLPFMYITKSDLFEVNKDKFQEYCTEEIAKKCIEACLLNLDNYSSQKFNRYEPQINLFHSIWYKINNKTYCFPQISASMNTHSFFSNLALIVHRKDTVQKKKDRLIVDDMENFISKLAKEKNFLVAEKRNYNFERNEEKFSGEVDAIIFDGKKLLVIEFKRSALRGSLAEINFEKEVVLEEAASQLNKFKEYVKAKPQDLNNKFATESKSLLKYDFGLIPIVGLIITTNFEHDHQLIRNKYMKISWIEWLWIMNDIENGDSIDEILIRIQNNTYWSEVVGI